MKIITKNFYEKKENILNSEFIGINKHRRDWNNKTNAEISNILRIASWKGQQAGGVFDKII